MTVLIADNDRAVSGLLTDVLKQSGLQMMHAYDGDEASRLGRDDRVRVLVCDLDMPGASGLEVLESLRDLPEPPLSIVISGYLDNTIEARLRALPFVREVLRKPFDLLVFAAVVRRLAAVAETAAASPERGTSQGQGTSPEQGARPEQVARPENTAQSDPQDGRAEGPGGDYIAVEH